MAPYHGIALAVALVAGVVRAQGAAIVLNSSTALHVYDGHGGLSAGASSRLLWDYQEPLRSDILDLLFKPSFGAALHTLKVEIGGDCQSTDGTEPSHQHSRDDLSCTRGYEFWLLGEAKKRNPAIKTYALSWGVPFWIGNGSYFTPDNWAYQTQFLKCVRETLGFDIDTIGIWNERSWGTPDYVIGLRNTLDAAGFNATQISLPDGGDPQAILDAGLANATFAAAIGSVGLHYPCNLPCPGIQLQLGKGYHASEDWWEQPNWGGAACWGWLLNHNYIAMNMTSTIAWSPIWSVYTSQPDGEAGLMRAREPWSGHYDVSEPLWTSAQWTQFTEPGWLFLHTPGGGSGVLPSGGTYVTLVPPTGVGVTVILETMNGECRCGTNGATVTQTVKFVLAGATMPLPGATLQLWSTNATALFVRGADVVVAADRSFTVVIPPDTMITVSSVTTAAHGVPSTPIPPSGPFPVPYSEDFNAYGYDVMARYWSDQYGSFAVRNGSLQQVVFVDPGPNAWVQDSDPITVLGEEYLSDVTVTVAVQLPAPPAQLQDGAPAKLVPCDASSTYQQWAWNTTGAMYLSNSPVNGATQCLNIYGCQTNVVYWSCVTEGGTCCGADCYTNLQWVFNSTLAGGDAPSADGAPVMGYLQSLLDGLCVTVDSPSSMTMKSCGIDPASQVWVYDPSTQLMRLNSTTTCLAQAAPPPVRTYAQLCARVTNLNGFEHPFPPPGYCLVVDNYGNWSVTAGASTPIAAGVLPGYTPTQWHVLSLTTENSTVAASVDGAVVLPAVHDVTYSQGQVALGSGYHPASFDNFTMQAATTAAGAYVMLV